MGCRAIATSAEAEPAAPAPRPTSALGPSIYVGFVALELVLWIIVAIARALLHPLLLG
jgi:hypothetical protein